MRGSELLDKMALIDPAYLAEAERAPVRRGKPWLRRAAAAAACLCAAAGALLLARPRLEKIEIPPLENAVMGYESYLYYDAAELENGNPWTADSTPSALPVYRNLAYHPRGWPAGLDETEMRALLDEAAAALGLELGEVKSVSAGIGGGDLPETGIAGLRAAAGGGELRVNADGDLLYVLPDGGDPVPADCADDAAIAEYFAARYGAFLGFASPRAAIRTERSYSGEARVHYEVYDAAGSAADRIVSYNLRSAVLEIVDGALQAIGLDGSLRTAEMIGDYPIISVAEAAARLDAGDYQTDYYLDTGLPGADAAVQVELVYRSGHTDALLVPFYRFYLPIASQNPNQAPDLKTCIACYVPAVRREYIK